MVRAMTTEHLTTPHTRQLALWVLRLFSGELLTTLLSESFDCYYADITRFLNLPVQAGPEKLAAVRQMMSELLDQLESEGETALDATVSENLTKFSQTLGLNAAESAILGFFVLRECEPVLDDSLQVVGRQLAVKPGYYFSKILGLDEPGVEAALRKRARLRSTGLLRFEINVMNGRPKLEFFSTDLAKDLIYETYDSSLVLSAMGVVEPDVTDLKLVDYPHLKPELSLLLDYLHKVVDSEKRGVNILLHGEPGTGKTQLTRVIANELGVPVYDFATCDKDGEPKKAETRLMSLRFAEAFFRDAPVLLAFDEVEDIVSPSDGKKGLASQHKGWFNRMLETNSRPIIWLSNSIRHLDAAFIRRFDFIIEVPVPPRSRRAEILRKHAGKHLSEHVIDRLAGVEALAPAVVTRVTKVFDVVAQKLPQDERDEAFSHMVSTVLRAQKRSVLTLSADDILPKDVYHTDCLNADTDLTEVARMLGRYPHARILLHGPPGTGKTAFGHWLAREIDRPLHHKRASDLLSPFVGGTEMQIAGVFDKALRADSILMIDEVDSFLSDRAKAVRSWEVTIVNELLTCMESYKGVFIATTNRLEHLDAASLRRFDLKLFFDFLNANQVYDLLVAWCRRLGMVPPTSEFRRMIETMDCVTPGDFAAVARRHRFQPFANAGELLGALSDECAMKAESAERIGFR